MGLGLARSQLLRDIDAHVADAANPNPNPNPNPNLNPNPTQGVNIAQQLNTSRDDIAYNVIDMQNFPKDEAADKLQLALGQLDSVISTRLIYTGSAAEGPASFYTKGGQVVFP